METSQPEPRTADRICAHCGYPMIGWASLGEQWLCHPDDGIDCYRLVTVYKHDMPCKRVSCRRAL